MAGQVRRRELIPLIDWTDHDKDNATGVIGPYEYRIYRCPCGCQGYAANASYMSKSPTRITTTEPVHYRHVMRSKCQTHFNHEYRAWIKHDALAEQ